MSIYLEGATPSRRHVTHNPGWYAVNEAVRHFNEFLWAGDRSQRLQLEEQGNGFTLVKTTQGYPGQTVIVKDASEREALFAIRALVAWGI